MAGRIGLLAALAALAALAGCSSAPKPSPQVLETKNRAAEFTEFGNRSFSSGDYVAAITHFQQALALNVSVDNEPGVVASLCSIGKVHLAVGQLDEAEELYRRAGRRAEALGSPALLLQCAVSLAELLLERGKDTEARELLEGALVHRDALAGTRDLAVAYHTLGVAERKLGALEAASANLERALAINRSLNAREETASNLYILASIASRRGGHERALALALEALEIDKAVENSLGIAQDLLALGIISGKLGRAEESFSYLERSHGIYSALRLERGLLSVLPQLLEAARATGRTKAAEAYAAELASLARP